MTKIKQEYYMRLRLDLKDEFMESKKEEKEYY